MTTERAVLAGGCFGGTQDLFRRYDGVLSTRVGYTGGNVSHATYRNHGSHAEGVEVIFDPARISYRQILEFFFQIHDPSTRNRQGNDVGTSYRSAIFYTSDEQRRIAEDTIADVDASGLWPGKLFQQATSGRPNPSIETTSNDIPAATPAISSGQTGGYRFARMLLQRRHELRSRFHPPRRNAHGSKAVRWSHAHEIPTKSVSLDLEFESAVFRNFRLADYTTTGMGNPVLPSSIGPPPSWRLQRSLSS